MATQQTIQYLTILRTDFNIQNLNFMINWNIDLHSLTPPKQSIDQGSTGCNKASNTNISPQEFIKQQNNHRKGVRRSSRQLSSQSDEEIKQIQKSIKKFKLEDDISPFLQRAEVNPFYDEEPYEQFQQQQKFENMDVEQHLHKRPTMIKKQSACEMDLIDKLPKIPPLYRMNSTIVGYTERDMLQFLGDNVYIRDIQKQSSGEDKVVKYQISGSSRFQTDYFLLQNFGKTAMFPGNIYKCLNKLDRMVYVIKQYNVPNTDALEFSVLKAQMEVSNQDRNNCLVKFYLSWFEHGSIWMVYEPGSFTITSMNSQKRKLTEKQIRTLLIDSCQSLEYLESKKRNHLNIKPSNILNCRGKFKLMDMISYKQNIERIKSYDRKYMAPQLCYPVLVDCEDLWKTDIYSLGMVIIENMLGKSSMHFQNRIQQRKSLLQNLQSMYQYSPSLVKLLMRMTSHDSKKRPTFKEIISVEELKNNCSMQQRKYSL